MPSCDTLGSITILPTYKCNAACEQCCFQSSPRLTTRLSAKTIELRLAEANKTFRNLKQAIFSGGEALLLKQDLFSALGYASALGLSTRLVSNGFWGKREATAIEFARNLSSSGLAELNISTGLDHQRYVPEASVLKAARAATLVGIPTLITVEADSSDHGRLESLMSNPELSNLQESGLLTVISNSWMPYQDNAIARHEPHSIAQLRKGCSQVFRNLTLKPDDRLSACCGLTMERIPEMDLGPCNGSNMKSIYESQIDDLMKLWIHIDGPYTVIEKSMRERSREKLSGVVHICQACKILHRDVDVATSARSKALHMIEEIISRATIKENIP